MPKSEWLTCRENAANNEAAICIAYEGGLSASQVAKKFNVSSKTVLNMLRRNGRTIRPIADGVSLRWKEPEFLANQKSKRTGISTWNKGKNYKLLGAVSKPSLLGEKNPNWKGGRLTWVLRVRKSGKYSFWRKSVFERDGYKCTACGRVGRLEADHIRAFSRLMDDHKIMSYEEAVECAALWDVSNGRTLCVACHRLTDTFGSKSAKRS